MLYDCNKSSQFEIFTKKRRRQVYEKISDNPLEEERFNAYIEACPKKAMKKKLSDVRNTIREGFVPNLSFFLSVDRLAPRLEAKEQRASDLGDHLGSQEPCRPAHRARQEDLDLRNQAAARAEIPSSGLHEGRQRAHSRRERVPRQWSLLEQRRPGGSRRRGQRDGSLPAASPTGSTQADEPLRGSHLGPTQEHVPQKALPLSSYASWQRRSAFTVISLQMNNNKINWHKL